MCTAKDGGAVVIQTTREEVRRAADLVADIIVAQAVKADGHVRSAVSTMVLVPVVCDAVPAVPAVAAGAMADARGIQPALDLGAQGVWLGTLRLGTVESGAHQDFKRRPVAAHATDTVYTILFDQTWPNAPQRTLRNSTFKMWEMAGPPRPCTAPKVKSKRSCSMPASLWA